jgi:hypothetical protein
MRAYSTYMAMIEECIQEANEKGGVSRQYIKK